MLKEARTFFFKLFFELIRAKAFSSTSDHACAVAFFCSDLMKLKKLCNAFIKFCIHDNTFTACSIANRANTGYFK